VETLRLEDAGNFHLCYIFPEGPRLHKVIISLGGNEPSTYTFAVPVLILLIISLACSSPFQPEATAIPSQARPWLQPPRIRLNQPHLHHHAGPGGNAAAESTAWQRMYCTVRSEMSEYEISMDSGYLGWVKMRRSRNLNGVNDLEYQAVADGLEAGDFILRTDITWNTTA